MDIVLFAAFPYVAVIVFVIGTIWRYQTGFKYSSLSSQFLETKRLFLASVPFHIGVLVILIGHFIGFLFPSLFTGIGGSSIVTFEVLALVFGIMATVGLLLLMIRRFTNDRIKAVTTKMDVFIELVLLVQFGLGIWIAISYGWGSQWYASVMVPYLKSIWMLDPDISAVIAMPAAVQLHIVGASLFIFLIPFSRFVHFLVAPFHYISRPMQVVRWYWDRKAIRDTDTPWTTTKPRKT
jgi:nitrate reductase gamma subunit